MYEITQDLISTRIPDADLALMKFLTLQLTALQKRLSLAVGNYYDVPATIRQIGFISGLLNIDNRDESIDMLSALMGFPTAYLGLVSGEETVNFTERQPGERTRKDRRITMQQASILIDWLLDDVHSQEVIDAFGYETKTDADKKRRVESSIAKQAALKQKAIEQAERNRVKAERELERQRLAASKPSKRKSTEPISAPG